MKLSDILERKVKELWDEAVNKPFLIEMLRGTLSEDRYRNYMLQDYLYLLGYAEILKETKEIADKPYLKDFVESLIAQNEDEKNRVHIPAMKKLGISDSDIEACKAADEVTEYLGYMHSQLKEKGIIAELTALLQCSWSYAHIILTFAEKYKNELSESSYNDWFEAYLCQDYLDTNQRWIDIIDKETEGIDDSETDTYCEIFIKCAQYENKFWDYLYG